MGVVYEAEQISLGRRVALKVLPLAAAMDPRQFQRFQNEAQAAACLHHTNIVPVYVVGCERGVHFYAMQFIEGQTLAAIIAQLQGTSRESEPPSPEPEPEGRLRRSLAAPCPRGRLASRSAGGELGRPSPDRQRRRRPSPPGRHRRTLDDDARSRVLPHGGRAGHPGGRGAGPRPPPWRGPPRRQAGQPADGRRGTLWVTDFGLAQFQDDAGLTMTGDLLGTLRYMSPEQAMARRGRPRSPHRRLFAGGDAVRAA